jgi:hypothetical protein
MRVEAGYDYICDWVLDDQPVWLKTRGRPIVSVPYTQECNDVAIDQFEQLHSDAQHEPRVMALVVHPYIMGVPHRLRYLREALAHIHSRPGVVFTTGSDICQAFMKSHPVTFKISI